MKVIHSVVSNSATPWTVYRAWLLCPWNSSGKSTGVGSHFLLQGNFSTQGLNPCLLHCGQILHCLRQAHQKAKVAVKFLQQCISLLHESYKWLNALRVCSVAQCVQLFATTWTVANQAPLSTGLSWHVYRVGCHFLLQESDWIEET